MARKSVADQAKAKAEKQKKMVDRARRCARARAGVRRPHDDGAELRRRREAGGCARRDDARRGDTGARVDPHCLRHRPSSGVPETSTTPSGSISQQLDRSAVQAPATVGQLQSFSLFESKDPFNAGGPSCAQGHDAERRWNRLERLWWHEQAAEGSARTADTPRRRRP